MSVIYNHLIADICYSSPFGLEQLCTQDKLWTPGCPHPATPLGPFWSSDTVHGQHCPMNGLRLCPPVLNKDFFFSESPKHLWVFLLIHHDSFIC